jgi:hypothetical protein
MSYVAIRAVCHRQVWNDGNEYGPASIFTYRHCYTIFATLCRTPGRENTEGLLVLERWNC